MRKMNKKAIFSVVGIVAIMLLFSPLALSGEVPRYSKIVDLSMVLNERGPVPTLPDGSPYWPPFKREVLYTYGEKMAGFDIGCITIAEHQGTHVDAPAHYGPTGFEKMAGHGLVTAIPLERLLFAPAIVIDISKQCAANNDYEMTVKDVKAWQKKYGKIPKGAHVMVYTGWSKRWETPERFLNKDADQKMRFPGVSTEAIKYIAKHDISGIGIDNITPDGGLHMMRGDWSCHMTILSKGWTILENVNNLWKLPPKGTHVIIAPLRVEGASGSPVRIFALVP